MSAATMSTSERPAGPIALRAPAHSSPEGGARRFRGGVDPREGDPTPGERLFSRLLLSSDCPFVPAALQGVRMRCPQTRGPARWALGAGAHRQRSRCRPCPAPSRRRRCHRPAAQRGRPPGDTATLLSEPRDSVGNRACVEPPGCRIRLHISIGSRGPARGPGRFTGGGPRPSRPPRPSRRQTHQLSRPTSSARSSSPT